MSISLCVLRIEVDDEFNLLPQIHYQASRRNEERCTKKSNYCMNGKSLSEIVNINRGCRVLHELLIESYQMEPNATSLEVNDDDKIEGSPFSMGDSAKDETACGASNKSTKENTPTCRTAKVSSSSQKDLPSFSDRDSDKKIRHRDEITFISGNPMVEVTKGILHLFKENLMTPLTELAPRSEMICMLSVPAAMSSHDLLQFLAPYPEIEHVRIIRDSTPNQYMVLLKFRHQSAADEFFHTFNNTRFNSIEDDICHLVYVAKVETTKGMEGGSLPLAGHTELPTCPVCLERMEESVDGILTILCNHSFHSSCLSKWGDTSCPVCRYSQTPEIVGENICVECQTTDGLWICLICGHVGCGRYVGGHAYQHFLDTQHTYAMQLGNNRVWDYVGDNFVHRLVQNKADGKLVELENSNLATQRDKQEMESDEKVESIQLEYTYLLTYQLESQRRYYEEKLTNLEDQSQKMVEELTQRYEGISDQCQELSEKSSNLIREKQGLEKKVASLTAKLSRVNQELEDELELNRCLRDNQSQWQKKVNDLESEMSSKSKEILELQEQMRDLMFHFSAEERINSAGNDLQDDLKTGTIVVPEDSAAPSGKSRRKKKR